MTYDDFSEFIRMYIDIHYGKDYGWDITMTTKRTPKNGNVYHRYTLFVMHKKTKDVVAKSDERNGERKNSWRAREYAVFISTLTPTNKTEV